MGEKLHILREPTRTIIAFDSSYYNVNNDKIEQKVRESATHMRITGYDISRAKFGEIVYYTNPKLISKKAHEIAIAELTSYILSCTPR